MLTVPGCANVLALNDDDAQVRAVDEGVNHARAVGRDRRPDALKLEPYTSTCTPDAPAMTPAGLR